VALGVWYHRSTFSERELSAEEAIFIKVLLLATVLAASPVTETITYHTTPCLGACPAYTVSVSSDGQAIYKGQDFVAVKGERSFQVTPSEFDAFRAQLAPYRPKQGEKVLIEPGSHLCPSVATDFPSIEITWSSGETLKYYAGCLNPKVPQGMWDSLAHAIKALPITKFVDRMKRP
jgi:hypothetical protein